MKYPQLVSMPSAVSNWLEEQLEALGIDSAIYTRYILSLLHADVLDVIYPEDDFLFSKLHKDGNRYPLNNNKHFRRSTKSWRRNAFVDAEQIKRSAAVECLMSAAEQSCEIESLVDQLCEKLKEVNSEPENCNRKNAEESSAVIMDGRMVEKISPKESAEKYYAAFPALNQKSETSYYASNLNLAAEKWPSDKTRAGLMSAKLMPPQDSFRTARCKQSGRPNMDNSFGRPAAFPGEANKNKSGNKRSHCGRNLSREMADNVTNWRIDHMSSSDWDLLNGIEALQRGQNKNLDEQAGRMKCWLANSEPWGACKLAKKSNFVKRRRLFDKGDDYVPLYSRALRSLPTEDLRNEALSRYINDIYSGNEFRNLQGDYDGAPFRRTFKGQRQEPQVDEEETAIKQEYNTPRRRLFSVLEPLTLELDKRVFPDSLGSKDDQLLPFSYEYPPKELSGLVDDAPPSGMGLVTLENLEQQDAEFMKQNRTNELLEDLERSLPGKADWASALLGEIGYIDFSDTLLDAKAISFIKINHNPGRSAFCEYQRPLSPDSHRQQGFFLPDLNSPPPLTGRSSTPLPDSPLALRQEEEDSKGQTPDMYFEPLDVLLARDAMKERDRNALRDGTTFNIRSNLDEVKYQRTESGSLIYETESGELQKYCEFKGCTSSEEELDFGKSSDEKPFVVKFRVLQNDKDCQTVADSSELTSEQSFVVKKNPNQLRTDLLGKSGDPDDEDSFDWLMFEKVRAELIDCAESEDANDVPDGEKVLSCAPEKATVFCKHCNEEHERPSELPRELDAACGELVLKDMLYPNEMNGVCPWSRKPPSPLEDVARKLREEWREDPGSLRQSSIATGTIKWNPLPADPNLMIKRRHSFANGNLISDVWSITSMLHDQKDFPTSLPAFRARGSVVRL